MQSLHLQLCFQSRIFEFSTSDLVPKNRESTGRLRLRVLQRVAVCCSVLQCVAVCCSVLQCVAVCCGVLQCVAAVRYAMVLQTHVPFLQATPRLRTRDSVSSLHQYGPQRVIDTDCAPKKSPSSPQKETYLSAKKPRIWSIGGHRH